jgi:hypothetical protein
MRAELYALPFLVVAYPALYGAYSRGQFDDDGGGGVEADEGQARLSRP